MTDPAPTTGAPALRRVLLADNSPDLAELLGEVIRLEPALEYVGHVMTGAAALERVQSEHVDVLVLDLGLEDVSGFDVLDRLAEAGSQVKVIVHTGHSADELAMLARRKGAAAFVVKDGDVPALLELIHSV
jgi:two-component system, NarL family, invasion response regulator UvrY